jgi:phosphopantetheinyl transferase (holo-ACP synthase)
VTHAASIALAIARLDTGQPVGIDVATLVPKRPLLARRVLREEELQDLMALEEEARWREVVIRFAAKEAVYKALSADASVSFGNLAIYPEAGGPGPDGFRTASVVMRPNAGAADFGRVRIEVTYADTPTLIVATARATLP